MTSATTRSGADGRILRFKDVCRFFGRTAALRGVDLEITEPGAYGLIGRNGAGKSTLLRMVPCLLHADRGSVRVFGLDPWKHQRAVKSRLGYVADSETYPPLVRARDLIGVHAASYPTWDRCFASELLARFAIDPRKRLSALSSGQRRQVAFLCAVAHRPELLILDEPAGGFDPVVRREFLRILNELVSEHGTTVLLSSHQFADVERLVSHVFLMHQGKIIADESLSSLQENAARVAVRARNGDAAPLLERIRALPRCVRAISDFTRDEDILVTLRLPPRAAEAALSDLGADVRQATGLGLEELFIDWTG